MGIEKKSAKNGRGNGGGGAATKADQPAAAKKGTMQPLLEESESTRRTCLHKQLRKTKFCMYHLQGVCQFGDSCAFAHTCDELQGAPDLRKTRLCTSFVNGVCQDPECTFAHTEEELRSTDMFYKKTLCMWHEKNACRNGDGCRFAHGVAELRSRAPHINPEKGKGGALAAPPKQTGAQPQRRNAKTLTGKGGRPSKEEADGYNTSAPVAYGGLSVLDDYLNRAQIGGPVPGPASSMAISDEPMFVKTLPASISSGFMQQQQPPLPPPGAAASQAQAAQTMMIAGQLYQCGQQLEQLRAVQSQLQRAAGAGYYSGSNVKETGDDAELSKLSQNISVLSEQLSRFEVQMQRQPEQEDPALAMALYALGNRSSGNPSYAALKQERFF